MAHHIQIGLEVGDESATELIVTLSNQLHHRISADIILFVASLNKHTVILEELVRTCDSLFVEALPATLDGDVAGLNNLAHEIEEISIPEKPEANRIAGREARDNLVGEHLAATRSTHLVTPPEPGNDMVQQLYDFNAAIKTIQILGQVIRNVGGRALKDQKSEVLSKIIGLTRRILGKYLAYVGEDSLNEFLRSVAEAQKEHMSELSESELKNEVCQHINGMLKFFCFSVIKHTTFSVGSENLAPTIRRLLEEDETSISKLMDLSLSLDLKRGFPRVQALKLYKDLGKNHFSSGLVRILVSYHMYSYVVPPQDRQAICDKMKIKLLPAVMDRSRKRLT